MRRIAVIISCVVFIVFSSSCIGNKTSIVNKQVDAVATLLSESAVAQLESASLVREFVFPYDFLQAPFPVSGKEWAQLRRNAELVTGERELSLADKILNRTPTPLTPDEQVNWEFYQALFEEGIDLAEHEDFFLLVIVNARAGFDMTEIKVVDGNKIELPAVKILSRNVSSEMRDGWPKISGMTPDVLNRVILYVMPFVDEEIEKSELLNMAEKQGRELIRNFFAGIGGEVIIN